MVNITFPSKYICLYISYQLYLSCSPDSTTNSKIPNHNHLRIGIKTRFFYFLHICLKNREKWHGKFRIGCWIRRARLLCHISRSAYRTIKFSNPEYFVWLLFEYFFLDKMFKSMCKYTQKCQYNSIL